MWCISSASDDGSSWTLASSESVPTLQYSEELDLYYGGSGQYFTDTYQIVSSTSLLLTEDLKSFSAYSFPVDADSWAVGNNVWVMQSQEFNFEYSNGSLFMATTADPSDWQLVWTEAVTKVQLGLTNVVFAQGAFWVANFFDKNLLTSTDALTWNVIQPYCLPDQLYSVNNSTHKDWLDIVGDVVIFSASWLCQNQSLCSISSVLCVSKFYRVGCVRLQWLGYHHRISFQIGLFRLP